MFIASTTSHIAEAPVRPTSVVVDGVEHGMCDDVEGRLGANDIE